MCQVYVFTAFVLWYYTKDEWNELRADLLFISWFSQEKKDEPPRPDGSRQPEGSKDKGNSYVVNQLNLNWERRTCLESPTCSTTLSDDWHAAEWKWQRWRVVPL